MAPYGCIYGLYDPRTGELRYVGQTTRASGKRLQEHLTTKSRAKHTYLAHWVAALWTLGLRPDIKLLAEASSKEDLDQLEMEWIAQGRGAGIRLTNHTEGGKGQLGRVVSDATRAKMSTSHKGRTFPHMFQPLSEATKVKLSEVNKGKRVSAETCLKLSQVLKGRVFSSSHRKALSEANRGKPRKKGCRVLTPSEVETVVTKASSGKVTATALGREFRVSYVTICRVLARRGIRLKAGRPYGGSRLV